MKQCRLYRCKSRHATEDIRYVGTSVARSATDLVLHLRKIVSARSMHYRRVSRVVCFGSLLPETGNGTVDNGGLNLRYRFVSEAKPSGYARTPVFDDNIRFCRGSDGYSVASFGFQVENYALLSAIQMTKEAAMTLPYWASVSVVITRRWFDFDDLSAQVGE